ncbi:sm-like protein LSM8 isoform X2 [Arachis ipaensis]|uniref:sm-like protein LSM8 isoform X2 n=1 Tax=Arachis ipaensis TaxID=130454 RepID=UPI000A2B3EAE|nr:sm-like protein LSM8 isoform X2 [Arachis ipaensis]XP_029152530.1 sm-like protein LSM8 isoform X2 [Arachis hypogaea]
MSDGPGLESLVDQTISVITNDGRNIVGILKGFDQATNIILDESHERVYSTKELTVLCCETLTVKHSESNIKFHTIWVQVTCFSLKFEL